MKHLKITLFSGHLKWISANNKSDNNFSFDKKIFKFYSKNYSNTYSKQLVFNMIVIIFIIIIIYS